jgi:hypothetical protein
LQPKDRVEGNRRGHSAAFSETPSGYGPAKVPAFDCIVVHDLAGVGYPIRVALKAVVSVHYDYSADTFVDTGGFSSNSGANSFLTLNHPRTFSAGNDYAGCGGSILHVRRACRAPVVRV